VIVAVADTHAVIWYLFGDPRLSAPARQVFDEAANEGNTIGLSTITLAEIVYLAEKGRIPASALGRIMAERNRTDAVLVELPIDRNIIAALTTINRSSVPDLPDRLIAATAALVSVPIISRDAKLHASGLATIW
jgi:PIN domain nuclease of toxin-antitoxin system